MLLSPSIGNSGLLIAFSQFLNCGRPQMNTTTHRMIQGSHADHTSACECEWRTVRFSASSNVTNSESRVVPTITDFGRHTLRKPARHAIDTSDATMSTSVGPWKLDIRNCGIANATPVISTAGQISIIRLKPANAQISQNGTISEKNGSWRPTIADRSFNGSPVTLCRPSMGVPNAP